MKNLEHEIGGHWDRTNDVTREDPEHALEQEMIGGPHFQSRWTERASIGTPRIKPVRYWDLTARGEPD
jgi:hypothetical protein